MPSPQIASQSAPSAAPASPTGRLLPCLFRAAAPEPRASRAFFAAPTPYVSPTGSG